MYSKVNYKDTNGEFANVDWESLFKGLTVEEMWNRFKDKYYVFVDRYVPFKMIKPGGKLRLAWTRYRSVKRAKQKCRQLDIASKESGLNAEAANSEYRAKLKTTKGDYEDTMLTN